MKPKTLFFSSLVAAAAMSTVPAFADEITLTNGEKTTLTITSGTTGSGNTYSYTAPSGTDKDSGGWLWLGNLQGTNNVAFGTSESQMKLSGTGIIAVGYQGGNGGGTPSGTIYNFDFSNTDASAFSGKFAVVNEWDNNTVVKLSGAGWSNVEYVSGGVSREQSWATLRSFANADRAMDKLELQGATTLAGITGVSKGYSYGNVSNVNSKEFVTASTTGTVLTLAGAGTYSYYGSVGTSSVSLELEKTGTGTQTFGGAANYLSSVKVSGGTLNLSGTSTLSGSVTVDSGATLDLSGGKVSLASAISNSGTVTVNSNTVFVLADTLGSNNIYTLITNTDGGSITGWDSNTLTISNFRQANGSTFSGRSTVNVATAGSVTITEKTGNLVWNGTDSSGKWDVQTSQNWTNGTSADYFYSKDNVTFNSSAGQKTVTLADDAAISVGTMTVESGSYTFKPTTTGSDTAFPSIAGTTLTVASGATMDSSRVNLLFDDVVVAGTLSFDAETAGAGTALNWSKLTFQGGTFHIEDTQNTAGNFLTIGEVAMSGNGTITSHWSRGGGTTLAISKLSGSGDLSITGGTEEPINYSLGSIDSGYSGTISVAKGADKVNVNLSVGAAAITGAASAKVAVGEGTTFSITGLGTAASSATVSGTGTIAVVGTVSSCTGDATRSYITLNNVSDTSKFTGVVELRNVQTVVSGNGASSFADASKVVLNNAALHFNNDKGTFSKDIEIGNGQNGYIRSYGNNKISSGLGATIDGNISGAGTLTANDGGDVTYNGTVNIETYSATGISVFNGSSNTIGAMTVSGLTLGENATLNISGASTISGTFSGAGTLDLADGVVLDIVGNNSATNQVQNTINVKGGRTLKFSGHDLMGWNDAVNVAAVLASDSAEKLARLDINDTGTMTFSRSITMNGNALISKSTSSTNGGKFNTFGGKITATGTNNTISDVEIQIRKDFEVEVSNDADVLEITSAIVSHGEEAGGITKTGTGTLILSGNNSVSMGVNSVRRTITVSAGTVVAKTASALGSTATTVASGGVLKVSVDGGVNVGEGSVTFNENAKFAVDLTKYTVDVDKALTIITASAISFNNQNLGTVTMTSEEIEKYFSATDSDLGDWATGYTRNWGYDNGALTLTLTTIPEPSTFGLLAGAGALALVAARRRRRAK